MASWDATGLLKAHWDAVGGRDGLADLTGIQRGTISGYNTGRLRLGMANATRIADALGVTIADLGAPDPVVAARVPTVLDRLAALEAQVSVGFQSLEEAIAELDARLRRQAAAAR